MQNKLTVFSVCVGDKYNPAYVYALKEMVNQHLTIDHDFICITTQKLPGIRTRNPPVPYYGWWSKIGLFYPRVATGPSLFFDLDVVITENIDYLADYTRYTFAAPANWAQSGHGGIQSSVMAWSGNWHLPYEKFRPQWPHITTRLHGDQEFLWELLKDDWVSIPHIGSYKYHARAQQAVPPWMKVMVFHGDPKPDKVNDSWLLPYTSTLRRFINSNTLSGSEKGLSATG